MCETGAAEMKIFTKLTTTALALFLTSHLSAQTASLEAPATGIVDETVKVAYQGPGQAGDEMTIGDARGIELRGTNPADLSDGEGTINLLMPSLPGLYTIIYRGTEGVLTTKSIQVTNPQFGISVAHTATVSGALPVYWSGANNGEAVLALRDSQGSVLDTAALPAGQSSGSARMQLPVAAGVYTINYVIGDNVKATRAIEVTTAERTNVNAPNQVRAGSDFQVFFSGPFNERDQIVLVESPPTAESILADYSYLNSARGTAVLRAPMTAGLYEVQYRNRENQILATDLVEVRLVEEATGSLTVVSRPDYQVENDAAMLVILDASGSMLKDQQGEDRIEIAKDTLLSFMEKSIPAGTPFAFRAFGHIEEGSCEGELLIPVSPFDFTGMAPIVKNVEAINLAKTPIAQSIEMIPLDLKGTTGERVVVLLTDGKETCDGNPSAAIRKVMAEYPNTRINIVGYNIKDDEIKRDFESWAVLGDGRYFSASEAESLNLALNQAVAIPFNVYQGSRLVASGLTGDAGFVLPNGEYEVAFYNKGTEVWKTITIADGEQVKVVIP